MEPFGYGKNMAFVLACHRDIHPNPVDESEGSSYDRSAFDNQITSFPLMLPTSLTLKTLFDICRSLYAWLSIDKTSVAVIHCSNGKSKTGLVVACFLRYTCLFDSTLDSFDYFVQRRCPATDTEEDLSWITPSIKRYLQYFNNVIELNGNVPNPMPLTLHRVILNTVPNFDGKGSCEPGIEIYQGGHLIYSSLLFSPLTSPTNSNEKMEVTMGVGDHQIFSDEYNIIFKLFASTQNPLKLHGDIYIRLFHQTEMKTVTMLTCSFNTGFMAAGLIRYIVFWSYFLYSSLRIECPFEIWKYQHEI
jgi:hypothetical protein